MSKTVIGLFPNPEKTRNAVQELEGIGVPRGRVQVMENGTHGRVVAALTGRGVSQDEAHVYAEGVRRGSGLVIGTVEDGQADQAAAMMDRHGSINIDKLGSRYRESGHMGFDASKPAYTEPDLTKERDLNDQITIPVIAEELQVGKRQVERGGTRIHTFISERPVDAQVTLRDENVTVNRRPVDRPATDADFQDRDIEMKGTSEEAVTSKTARVVEEVVIGRTGTDRTETVHDTVRRTEVEVEDLNKSAPQTNRR